MSVSSQNPVRKKQVVLRGAQLETAVGAELCQILAAIADDGRVDVSEVARLCDWLRANQSNDIPAIGHLLPIIERILTDGVVTADESAVLQVEIERVLPPDLRAVAKLSRKQALADEKERNEREFEAARVAKNEARQRELEESRRNGPAMCLDFVLAGVNYEGRGAYIDSRLVELSALPLHLALQPDNPYDFRAVGVLLDGHLIGYMPRGDAADAHPLLASGHVYFVRVKTTICGRQHTIPIIDGEIYAPGSAKGAPAKILPYGQAVSGDAAGDSSNTTLIIVLGIIAACLFLFIATRT